MTELPVIILYCKGTPGVPHERFVVAAYQRTHTTPTPTPALWTPLPWWNGKQLRKVEVTRRNQPGTSGRLAWLGFRFDCAWCPSDELHVVDDRGCSGKIYAVFDGLWVHNVTPLEISVRGLVGQVRR
jgi:hypothetical protein